MKLDHYDRRMCRPIVNYARSLWITMTVSLVNELDSR